MPGPTDPPYRPRIATKAGNPKPWVQIQRRLLRHLQGLGVKILKLTIPFLGEKEFNTFLSILVIPKVYKPKKYKRRTM